MRVGFVGLGDIGAPMARCLGARFDVLVWARRPETTVEFAAVAPTLAELAAADVVGICVTDDAAVDEVGDTLLEHLRPGAVLCVHSTVRPATVEALAARSASRAVDIVDAPVSGGADGAAAGSLRLFVGGEVAAIERCRRVLEVLGEPVVVGAVGDGQRVKLLNNALYLAQLALGHAALDVAVANGLERTPVREAVAGGSGGSYALSRLERLREPLRARHVAGLLDKDLGLFDELAGAEGASITSVARPFLEHLRSVARG